MFTILINFIDHLLKPCPKFYFYHVYRDKFMYCKLEIYYTPVIVSHVFFSFFWTWNCILLRITSLISNISIFFAGITELYGEGQTAGLRILVSTGEQNHRGLPPGHNILCPVPQQCQESGCVWFLVEAC